MRALALWMMVAAGGTSCNRDSAASAPPPADSPAPPVPRDVLALPHPVQLPRASDPTYRQAVRAFERGDFVGAQQLRLSLPDSLDVALLGARLHAVEGDDIAAVRAIESLRSRFATQARVYATAAEIHAAAGRLSSAEEEIREGLAIAGPVADLTRARGVLALCREGGLQTGLEHLLAARAAEPELEFCDRPLSQAHVLLGNAALAAQDVLSAAAHGQAALRALPDDLDALELLADALAGLGDFDAALEHYETLALRDPRKSTALALLHIRGATAALLQKDRSLAVERYLRARELGATDSELGFGATVLGEEAQREIDAGLDAYERGDLTAARAAFEDALRCAPRSIEARNHLAVTLFRDGDFDGAAAHWQRVLDQAREETIGLPEPVHLNLARALYRAGRVAEVRAVLERYLADLPDGEYVSETREMLGRLDAEDATGR